VSLYDGTADTGVSRSGERLAVFRLAAGHQRIYWRSGETVSAILKAKKWLLYTKNGGIAVNLY